MNGSLEIASVSGFIDGLDGLGPDRPERSPLDDVREASVIFTTLLRCLMIKKVATKTTIRIKTAPPIMPPSSAVDKPPFDEPVAAVFATGEAGGVILGTFPESVVEDPVGASKTVTEVMVVVIVVGNESIVVTSVIVTVNVDGVVS
jgi:hypothetical protein